MKPAMYLFINKGLCMSPGKIAAQAGHAAVEAALLSHPDLIDEESHPHLGQRILTGALWDSWRKGLHYAKYVMEARDSEHLRSIETYLKARGFRTVLVIDEGHTEVPPISPTALGVALVDKDDEHTAATFASFKLYRESRPTATAEEIEARHRELYDALTAVRDYRAAERRGRIMNAAGPFLRAVGRG